uniref:Uncharacterized protein n=1 Tax=Sphaerodactylus townsendi TaxID=933632 RepID=A0ACB8FS80_9SAUR
MVGAGRGRCGAGKGTEGALRSRLHSLGHTHIITLAIIKDMTNELNGIRIPSSLNKTPEKGRTRRRLCGSWFTGHFRKALRYDFFLNVVHWPEVLRVLVHWPEVLRVLVHWPEVLRVLVHWPEVLRVLVHWAHSAEALRVLVHWPEVLRVLVHWPEVLRVLVHWAGSVEVLRYDFSYYFIIPDKLVPPVSSETHT